MVEEVYDADGGEMTQVAMGLFIHLARTRGPFRVVRAEMDQVLGSMNSYRLQIEDGPSELLISVEPRE